MLQKIQKKKPEKMRKGKKNAINQERHSKKILYLDDFYKLIDTTFPRKQWLQQYMIQQVLELTCHTIPM